MDNIGCVREKTIRDRIFELGNPELTHNYEVETKRIIAMLDEEEALRTAGYLDYTDRLERKIKEQEIIISSLVECLGRRGNG